jgi:hypothetical protein
MADAVEYRDIPGFAGYRVGSDGSVWSCKRRVGRPGGGIQWVAGEEWKKLRLFASTSGHLFVVLYGRTRYVHRLVLEAFVGPCPDGLEGCHDPDPDPSNNSLSNLRWDTPKANVADSVRHGTHCCGESSPHAKLTAAQVCVMRSEYAAGGIGTRRLARRYDVSHTTVKRALARKTWRHVD